MSLDEKIWNTRPDMHSPVLHVISVPDVKQFIKELKEELNIHERINFWIVSKIDKLAGKGLI